VIENAFKDLPVERPAFFYFRKGDKAVKSLQKVHKF
jgi:hypothetical protein